MSKALSFSLETAMIASGLIGNGYTFWAEPQGLPVGAWWVSAASPLRILAIFCIFEPAVNMILRGAGWSTLWQYPAALLIAFVSAWIAIEVTRKWAQFVALVAMPATFIAEAIFAR